MINFELQSENMRFKILAIVFIFRDRKSNLMFEALLSQNLNSFGLIESTYNSFAENYRNQNLLMIGFLKPNNFCKAYLKLIDLDLSVFQNIFACSHIIIVNSMSVQGFRNLIKTALFTDDSFQPLLKKSDQYRKITQVALLHFQNIVKNFQLFEKSYEKIIVEYQEDIQLNQINVPQYYQKYIQLYRNMWSEQRSFSDKFTNNFRELSSLCDNLFTNFSNTILSFQGYIRSYKGHEQVLIQLSKKYFRTHKSMISNIDYYKQSFTDVKLIYNIDQKNKRFNVCDVNYKNLLEELQTIQDKVSQLSNQKEQIIDTYKEIEKDFILTLKAIGSKLIAISRSFIFDFCQMEKIAITYLAEKKFTLEKIELKTFFTSQSKLNFDEYFNVQIDHSKLQFYPLFVVYHKQIKDEYYIHLGKMLSGISKQNDAKIDKRKKLNKKVFQFTNNFVKIYEKAYHNGLKQIITNFEKVKKRMSQIFGNKLCSFLKSIHNIFELSIGINQKLLKRTISKLKSVELLILEEQKILELFQKEFNSSIQKFMRKKQLKKLMSSQKQISEFTEEQPSLVQIGVLKSQISEKSQYLSILIDGFVQKLKRNYDQLKFNYNAFVNDISVSTNEFYSLCCEYQELYFGEEEFLKNYKKYEVDIDNALLNQCKFFQEINFGTLLTDDPGKVIFQAELSKVQEFKKLKRPTEIQVEKNQQVVEKIQKEKIQVQQTQNQASGDKNQNPNKHQDFLLAKISFLPEEKFYKSFSCALSDKILLTGRLFITNKRLCFHSKFNPNNVFFGDTFIQIPKKDINKIEKRYNAIVFDNSISITTVNGEVFLTSFFSRNEAYNLICEALQIDSDELMFEPSQIKDQVAQEIKQVPQEDDLSQGKSAQRQAGIKQLLSNHPYKEILKTEFAYPGFTAFKYLKTFQVGGEFVFNRKTYKNFSVYVKQCLQHKQYEFEQWSPSHVTDFLNSANIKNTTPLSFIRKISCLVPVANTGVPFMPKQAKSQQRQTLYLVSKDKYIIQSTIQNSGVPYSNTFNIKLLKVLQTLNQNCCRLTVSIYLNFVSDTMMRGVIEGKSTEETKVAVGRIQAQAKKYLNYLQRSKLKEMKGQKGLISDNIAKASNNEEYEKQINELKQNEQKLQNEIKISNLRVEQGKKILLVSLLLNVLLILILLA